MSNPISKPPSNQQIEDWIDNPVTISLRELFEKEFADIQGTAATDCLFRGEPQKTQENLVELEARESVWELLVALLGGDWSYFIEEEEDE